MPSMVVIFFPATAETGVTHERIGEPFTWTVQAPPNAMPQPNLVPVRPTTSRNAHRSGMSAGTSTFSTLPLMFAVAMCVSAEGTQEAARCCSLAEVLVSRARSCCWDAGMVAESRVDED